MIFDLTDWLPHQTIGMSIESKLVVLIALGGMGGSVVLIGRRLWEQYYSSTKSEGWCSKAVLWVAIVVGVFGTVCFAVSEIPQVTARTVKTTSVSQYIIEKAAAYTPALTDVECDTPLVENKSTFLAQEGRYPCTWRFDGKPVTGSISITDAHDAGFILAAPTANAMLLDSHGDAWCPVEWKTTDGCKPITK